MPFTWSVALRCLGAFLFLGLAAGADGCLLAAPPVERQGVSTGWVERGMLRDGVGVGSGRPGSRIAIGLRPERRFASAALAGLLDRAAARVASEHAGSRLRLMDVSAREGGWIDRHRSHESGRDADVSFFVSSTGDEPVDAPRLVRFDRHGAGVCEGRACRFDAARNWALVRALLEDSETAVQWIFVSRGLKALLLEHALGAEENPVLVARAVNVLHQPGEVSVHDDHFHVRVYCTPDETILGCRDHPPIWPWVEKRLALSAQLAIDDRTLIRAALQGLDPNYP